MLQIINLWAFTKNRSNLALIWSSILNKTKFSGIICNKYNCNNCLHIKSCNHYILYCKFVKTYCNWLKIIPPNVVFNNTTIHYPRNPEIRECKGSCGISLIHLLYSQGCNLYKLSQKCNLYKLLGDTFYNFYTFCLIRNNTCMLSNFKVFFLVNPSMRSRFYHSNQAGIT